MRGLAFLGIGKVGLVERAIPQVGPGEAIVRSTASLICTCDVHTVAGVRLCPSAGSSGTRASIWPTPMTTKSNGVIKP
jgi:threonine dehydrogenase-like Zn-dependent dehydrogenase